MLSVSQMRMQIKGFPLILHDANANANANALCS